MISILQRLTAIVCLAVVLVTGLTPANGFVICLEPDGCVTLEVETSARECGGCEGHEEAGLPIGTDTRAASNEECPCFDLPIPGSSEDRRLERRPIELRIATLAAPAFTIAEALASGSNLHGSPRAEPPRPTETLELIRTVVLLV